jgi:serine/threonine protein kinase
MPPQNSTPKPIGDTRASVVSNTSSLELQLRPSFVQMVNNALGGERTSSFTQEEEESSFAPDHVLDQRGPAAPIPKQIAGRFTIQREIGSGGFGVVYLAHDESLDRDVAIKVPHEKLRSDPKLSSQCLKEARLAAKLRHPSIVTIFDISEDQGRIAHIVQEYVRGATLYELMSKQRFSVRQSIVIVMNVAEAIAFAHARGVYHRDLKPANLMVDEAGGIRVLDFGLAIDEEMQRGARGQIAGTLSYMSPEQIEGRTHHLDGRSDIWSLGVIFYELLAGRRPFRGNTSEISDQVINREAPPPRQFMPEIPKSVEASCLKCLSKAIPNRYSSAKDLLEDLQQIIDSEELPDEIPGAAPVMSPIADTKRISGRSSKRIPKAAPARMWPRWAAVWIGGGVVAVVVAVLLIQSTLAVLDWASPRHSPKVNPADIPMPIGLAVRTEHDLLDSEISALVTPKNGGLNLDRKEQGIQLSADAAAAIQFEEVISCENYSLRMDLSPNPQWKGAFFILLGINESKIAQNYAVSHFVKLFQGLNDGKWYMAFGYASFDKNDLIQEYEIRRSPLKSDPAFSQLVEIHVRGGELASVTIDGEDYHDIALSKIKNRVHFESFESQYGVPTDNIQGRMGLMSIGADLLLKRAILLEYYPVKN